MVDGNITPDTPYLDIGADASWAGGFQLPVDPSGVIQLAGSADVLGRLPPQVVNLGSGALHAIGSVADQVAGALPAINLIADISTGHAPTDPQQIIPALAATAAIINPVAGALIGAAGELMVGLNDLGADLFKSLGLISSYGGQAYDYFGFIKKGDAIPWGTSHPNWKTWNYWMTPVAQGWRWGTLPFSGPTYYRQLPWINIITAMGRYPNGGAFDLGPIAQNDFETYFFAVLKLALEKWMNANPTVSPRDLLRASAALWNHTHPDPSIGTRTYSPLNVQHQGMTVTNLANPIEVILSSVGDTSDAGMQGAGSDIPPITVNVAPRVTPARPMSVADAFAAIQRQIAAAMPQKTVISMKGVAPPPKTVIDLRAASQAIVAQRAAPKYVPVQVVETPQAGLLSKVLPFAPTVGGVLLMPVAGFLAPVVGVAASALWLWKRTR